MDGRHKVIASWTIVATVLGAMMSIQYHDVILGGAAIWSSSPDVAAVASRLQAVKAYNASLASQIRAVDEQMIGLQDKALKQGGAVALLARQLHAAKVLAGTVPVAGPGIEVTIDDSRMTRQERAQFITHDWDLRGVVNELFVAGADAVAVNHARVTSATGVFCIGPVVRIGDMRLGPPFTIYAIGDPQVLAAALNLPGGVLDSLRGVNRGLLVTDPKPVQRIVLPAYESPLDMEGGNNS